MISPTSRKRRSSFVSRIRTRSLRREAGNSPCCIVDPLLSLLADVDRLRQMIVETLETMHQLHIDGELFSIPPSYSSPEKPSSLSFCSPKGQPLPIAKHSSTPPSLALVSNRDSLFKEESEGKIEKNVFQVYAQSSLLYPNSPQASRAAEASPNLTGSAEVSGAIDRILSWVDANHPSKRAKSNLSTPVGRSEIALDSDSTDAATGSAQRDKMRSLMSQCLGALEMDAQNQARELCVDPLNTEEEAISLSMPQTLAVLTETELTEFVCQCKCYVKSLKAVSKHIFDFFDNLSGHPIPRGGLVDHAKHMPVDNLPENEGVLPSSPDEHIPAKASQKRMPPPPCLQGAVKCFAERTALHDALATCQRAVHSSFLAFQDVLEEYLVEVDEVKKREEEYWSKISRVELEYDVVREIIRRLTRLRKLCHSLLTEGA